MQVEGQATTASFSLSLTWEPGLQTSSNNATLSTAFGQLKMRGNGRGVWAHPQSKGVGGWAASYKCSIPQPHPNMCRRQWLCNSIIFKMLTRITTVD